MRSAKQTFYHVDNPMRSHMSFHWQSQSELQVYIIILKWEFLDGMLKTKTFKTASESTIKVPVHVIDAASEWKRSETVHVYDSIILIWHERLVPTSHPDSHARWRASHRQTDTLGSGTQNLVHVAHFMSITIIACTDIDKKKNICTMFVMVVTRQCQWVKKN